MYACIRVVIIEDDKILLQAYKQLIEAEDGIVVVNGYTSFEHAEKYLADDNPDIVLLDIQLPGISGIEAIPKIKRQLPKVHVLMLTVFESEQQLFQALANGASGYITKDSSSQKIIDSIFEVKDGGGPMSTNIARMVVRSFQKSLESPLSKRETEILRLITDGKKRSEIADELFIELETVKTHIKNIYTKLDVHSRSKAINIARKNKLI
ncbi:MAG TPA: response regulator transcription factor [Mucilaginibacter sp.]|nr:response regulator transcription factor [Mucilaginibacter sp.]